MNEIKISALSIQVSLNGLSFCIKNNSSGVIEYLSTRDFDKNETPYKVQDYLEEELDKDVFRNREIENVLLIHRNELSTFIPQEFFHERHLADYLKFNAKILGSDYLSYDTIPKNDSVNVYVPLVNINNSIIDKYGEFIYKHSSTILIETLLKLDYEKQKTKIFINVEHNAFEMVIIAKGSLLFYNMFDFSTQEDMSYYILFTMEQLNLSVEKTILRFLGGVSRNDKNFEVVYKYVRDVDILENVPILKYSQDVNVQKLKDHFILINSFQ